MKRAGRPSTISLRWETWNGVHQTRHRENSGCFTWRTRLSVRDILVCCLNKLYDVPVYISCTVLIKRNVNIKKKTHRNIKWIMSLAGWFSPPGDRTCWVRSKIYVFCSVMFYLYIDCWKEKHNYKMKYEKRFETVNLMNQL